MGLELDIQIIQSINVCAYNVASEINTERMST